MHFSPLQSSLVILTFDLKKLENEVWQRKKLSAHRRTSIPGLICLGVIGLLACLLASLSEGVRLSLHQFCSTLNVLSGAVLLNGGQLP